MKSIRPTKNTFKKKTGVQKLTPSQLVQKQLQGDVLEEFHAKQKIVKFCNLADYSIYTDTQVPVDEPLFEAIPSVISFTDYEPLQLKEKVFKLRNKDKVARRVKILQPDSRLFQVVPAPSNAKNRTKSMKQDTTQQADQHYAGNKIAPGMEACFYIRFSPEAKIDYKYDLQVVTEREQFIVPIYCVGKRAMIDFPDVLDFESCPVKYVTEKPVIIRNLGEKTTKWFLNLPKGFDADKKEGVLEYGKNEQICIKFYPTEAITYKAEATLTYDKLTAYIAVMGNALNSNVYLSKSFIQMDDAYIGLQTQQTLQIINKSSVKVDFEWRAFATEKEEFQKKERLRLQLQQEEDEEKMLLKEIVNNEGIQEQEEIEDHDDSDDDQRDEKAILLKRQRKAELMLERKYKNIRKAIEDDLLLFQDDIFSIEPQQGQIWPGSEMTITVTFVPKGALQYTCVSYCNISCYQERLALTLSGEGIGPKASLSQNEIAIGNKFVNEVFQTEITINNNGEIECRYELLPNERIFGKMFKFEDASGVIPVGGKGTIKLYFCSTIPGEFKETFRFRLEGSTELATLTCSGHVIPPAFSFNTDLIDFKEVSYQFTVVKKIELTNESSVDFRYRLRIPGDEKLSEREFEITPSSDLIQAKRTKEIEIKFTPKNAIKYETVLQLDIKGVGEDMCSLPIKAECQVPQVDIKPKDILDFGDVFLRDPDTKGITLINNSSHLDAKFEILPQNEELKNYATFKVDQDRGIIPAGKEVTIRITLQTNSLKIIQLPVHVKIIGANNNIPKIVTIQANSIGPIVEVAAGQKELDFGTCDVLTPYSQKITIKNMSKIIADIHPYTFNRVSVFKPVQKHFILQPKESMEVEIICCCDDAVKFNDTLYFKIQEGMDKEIQLKAKGRGSTISCNGNLQLIDFGTQYTHRTATKEIFVENKGRKPQTLVWQKKPLDKKQKQLEQDKKDRNKGKIEEEEPEIFIIKPMEITLPPKWGILFQFLANSTKRGNIQDQYILNVKVGNETKVNQLFEKPTIIQGEFIQPTLVFSEKKMYFKYTWEKNVPFQPISKNLQITCGSALPVNFFIKCQPPFSINQDQFSLEPGKSVTLRVDFDPAHKFDRVSGELNGKLQIIHSEHPHKEAVDLVGEVCFPNVKLDTNLINFGSILNDTSKKMLINMENTSEMGLYYEWTFVEEELITNQIEQSERNSQSSRNSLREQGRAMVPINEVFDILPLSGYLEPGEVEQVEFVYNAFGGQRFKTTAVCHIEGGPQYETTLIGDSSLITYRLSTNNIDLGEIRYSDWMSKDFFIENTGKVTFEYKILYFQVKRKGYIQCTPDYGRILGGEKQRINVKICPVMPDTFKEIIMIQVGYFEPEQIIVQGKGVYPAVLSNLPRTENLFFKTKFQAEFEKKKLERENTLKRQQLMAKAQEGQKTQQVVGAGVKSLEQIQQEIQKELDRQWFCELIQQALDQKEQEKLLETNRMESRDGNSQFNNNNNNINNFQDFKPNQTLNTTMASKFHAGQETKLYEKIILTSYICDFGNVVINKPRKMTFKIQNISNSPVDLHFDTMSYRNKGFSIQPERVMKLPPNEESTITVSYVAQAKKSGTFFGKNEVDVPIILSNGPNYSLKLISNITIPEIFMEGISDFVNFEKVLCGQRKTVFVRLVNDKEIQCDWKLLPHREMMGEKNKEPIRFQMTPTSGSIPSGQKQIIKIFFAPGFEKDYSHKFVLDIDQNPQKFPIVCKGSGTSINLQFEPMHCNIGPTLPYDKFQYCILQVKNPTEYDTELISIDYDQKYLEDEQILEQYDELKKSEEIFVDVRKPGQDIWPEIRKQVDKKKLKQEILAKLNYQPPLGNEEGDESSRIQVQNPLSPEEREELQKQLDQLNIVHVQPDYPEKVDPELLHHVVIYGPEGCGKTDAAHGLAKEHKRLVMNLGDYVDWCIENQVDFIQEIRDELEALNIEKDKILEERAKLEKKAGKKAPELQEKWGPVNEAQFYYLSEDLLVKCLKARLAHPDCGAGIIVDGLKSKYYVDEAMGLKVLMRAAGNQAIQFIHMAPQYEDKNLPLWKVIEWEGMENKPEEEVVLQQNATQESLNNNSNKRNSKIENKSATAKQGGLKINTKKSGKNGEKKEKQKKQVVEEEPVESPLLFEVFEPKEFQLEEEQQEEQVEKQEEKTDKKSKQQQKQQEEEEEKPAPLTQKEKYEQNLEKLIKVMRNEVKEKWEVPAVYDPVFEEGKKEEKKPKKDSKKGKKDEPEEAPPEPEVFDYTNLLHQGKRITNEMVFHYNKQQLIKSFLEIVPKPEYPDPNTQPIPEPQFQQILVHPSKLNQERKPQDPNSTVNKYFQILTPQEEEKLFVPTLEQWKSILAQKKKEKEQLEKAEMEAEEEERLKNQEEQEKEEQQQKNQEQDAKGKKSKPQTPADSKRPTTREKKEQDQQEGKAKPHAQFDEVLNTEQEKNEEVNLRKQNSNYSKQQSFRTTRRKKDEIKEEEQLVGYEPPKFEREELVENKSRWVIPAKRTVNLVIRFFTKAIGTYEGKLDFENFFSLHNYQVDVTGISDFPTISQMPKQIYWNVKKSRPVEAPQSYLSKVYVTSEKIFDFGPLLIGKNPQEREKDKQMQGVNSQTFQISNSGKFDAKIQFGLLSSVIENNQDYKKDIFFFEPKELVIPENEPPQTVRVWAIPNEAREFKDDLIVMIQDNPNPVILPMKATGAKPQVDIIEGEPVLFDRLLLNQSDTKVIQLQNNGLIPCKWKLTGIESLPEEFNIENTSGELKPTQKTEVLVSFKALKQQKFSQQLTLQVEDVENIGIKQEDQIIKIDAEAFDITVEFKFPDGNEENLLDFDNVRVGDIKDQFFNVKNNGLYQVKFSFAMKKKLFKDNFAIEPEMLDLEPQQEKQIRVRFCSQNEVKLHTQRHNTDIIMEIKEGQTQELFKPVPINVKVNSVFSKYSITPIRNLNFGAIQFNETKKLQFEIKNEGLFDFNYTIFDFKDEEFRKQLQEQKQQEQEARLQEALQVEDPKAKGAKKAAKKDTKAQDNKKSKKGGKGDDPAGMKRVGQWSINPSTGSVGPDSSAVIEIEFSGNGMKLYQEKLAIDVSGRDPADSSDGIEYDVVGESCIPGINCDNFESIFEEQIIVASQTSSQDILNKVNSNVFFYEEKTFHFGTLVPAKFPDGICEKFKIINPYKIPCTVKFDVRKRNANSNENFCFEISKKEAKIHPNEHVYVKVYFKPTIMAQYHGIFEAIVQNGEQNPKSHKLVFDLRGEGAMPTIKLEKPKEYHNESTPILKFQKVRVGKSVTLPIVLQNPGSIPATCKWDLNAHEDFRFVDQNSFSLTPKTYATFNIEFCPKNPGQKQWEIACQTMLNPYELTKFMIQGEGFYEDVVFENLPDKLEDEINLGDCVINQEKKAHFAIKNNSDQPIKFNWNTQGYEEFTFYPRTGHINSNSTMNVFIVFKSLKSVTHNKVPIFLETQKITQTQQKEFQEWNDTLTNIKYVTQTEFDWYMKRKEEAEQRRKEEEAQQQQNKKQKKQDKKPAKKGKQEEDLVQAERPPTPKKGEESCIPYEEPVPEPQYEAIEKSEGQTALKVSVISDFARYEVSTREIFFNPTLMYTQRSYQFTVKNTSLINLKYSCKIIQYEDNMPIVDPGYFYLSPKNGQISPQSIENFEVTFLPTEVSSNNERFIIISIDDLEPNAEPLVIELDGEAERPICHFELPPSNYREKKPDLDSQYNIIEFSSLGTKVKNAKRFYAVNPTATGYEFQWQRVQAEKLPPSANVQNENFFKCVTQKGICLSGKKFEMIFEYTPDVIGAHESYWIFEIPELNLKQYFLLVGNVIEPNVFFNVGKVNFGPLLIGGKNKETVYLKNLEEIPVPFVIDKKSVMGDPDYGHSLTVSPMQGTIRANGQVPIELNFHPQVESDYNYNLLCSIKRKSRPVGLNIKGIGYILSHSVFLENQSAPLESSQTQVVRFGDIYINEKRTRKITIQNKGQFNFDFSIKKSANFSFISISHEHGTVKQNENFEIEVHFVPIAEYNLTKNKCQFQLNITSGPSYVFQLQGSSKKPGVDLSFTQYDFGPQFVLKQPLPKTIYLEVKNRDHAAMSIETNFEKKNYLDVQLASGQVIMPLQVETFKNEKGLIQQMEQNILKIPITFTPRECKKYDETFTLDINNLYKVDIRVTGEGTPYKLELEKTEDTNLEFGVARVNQSITKIVPIINNSRKPITINLNLKEQKEELKKLYLRVIPDESEFVINPREKREIEVTFNPKARLHQFRKELMYQIVENQEQRKLLNINGTCHGIELKLLEDTVGFGVVVINSKKTLPVNLSNMGDIGAKFEWDTTFCKKFFTISPSKGYIPPHEEQVFNITFHPNVVDSDIRFDKVRCNIEGSDPLYLNLLGKCMAQPAEQIQSLDFQTIVRTPQVKKVQVKNPSNEACKIKVSVSANNTQFKDYFKGKETLEIGPSATADYELTYLPLTMTAVEEGQENKHTGHLFFPLPDGTALLYNLTGSSQPPNPEKVFDVNCKAKQTKIQVIPIKNWLKQLQRFKITWEIESEEKNSIFISGANTFDVAAQAEKDYKLSLYALKQINAKVTVTFKNEKTGEYLQYKINFNVSPPDALKPIELTSVVREIITKLVTVENPLDKQVEITKEQLTVDSDTITFNPSSFTIPAHSEAGFEIVYRPLLAKEENAKVQLKSQELGDFTYPLILKGVAPSAISRTMNMQAMLGADIVQMFKITNYCKKPTQYTARIDKVGAKVQPVDPKAKGGKEAQAQVDFTVEVPTQQVQQADTQEGNDVVFNIRYEPSNLGQAQAQLTIQSPEGGEYQCILNGQSQPPQPKGPFKMAGAKPEPIQFKNPFFEAQEFTIRIDNPNFTTSVKSPLKIDGKKPVPIPIQFKAQGGSNNGRLIITAEKGNYPPWIFYLQGE